MQDTNLKPTIKIEWLSDDNDCEQCGYNYSYGARVWLEGAKFLELIPSASCFGGNHWDESDVYKEIFDKLGYRVEMEY